MDNPCPDYCGNNGLCQLDFNQRPYCRCVNDWTGETCQNPPYCIDGCGGCLEGSVINECR